MKVELPEPKYSLERCDDDGFVLSCNPQPPPERLLVGKTLDGEILAVFCGLDIVRIEGDREFGEGS